MRQLKKRNNVPFCGRILYQFYNSVADNRNNVIQIVKYIHPELSSLPDCRLSEWSTIPICFRKKQKRHPNECLFLNTQHYRCFDEAGLDKIIVLPPSSWRQADVPRTSALRWVQVPYPSNQKQKDIHTDVLLFLVGEAGLEPARPQWTLEPESSESTNSTTRPSLFSSALGFPQRFDIVTRDP